MSNTRHTAHDAQPMTHDSSSPIDVSRRSLVRNTSLLLAGGTVVAFGSSGSAQAAVDATPIEVEDAVYEGEDGTVAGLKLSIEGQYQYTVNAAESVRLTLMVASAPDKTDYEPIAQSEESALAASTAAPYTMSGSILDHPQLSADMFSAKPSTTTHREVPVMIVFEVFNGGEMVVDAIGETIASIEVTSTAVAVSAEVTGNGAIEVEV